MNLTFLTPRDDAWDGFLAGVAHDFYHTASYGLFSSKYDGGEVEAVLVTDGALYFFLPYIVRSLSSIVWLAGQRKGLFDITSPYGYPGPLCSPGDAGFLRAAVAKWCDVLRERGAVSGFVRMHPLLPVAAGGARFPGRDRRARADGVDRLDAAAGRDVASDAQGSSVRYRQAAASRTDGRHGGQPGQLRRVSRGLSPDHGPRRRVALLLFPGGVFSGNEGRLARRAVLVRRSRRPRYDPRRGPVPRISWNRSVPSQRRLRRPRPAAAVEGHARLRAKLGERARRQGAALGRRSGAKRTRCSTSSPVSRPGGTRFTPGTSCSTPKRTKSLPNVAANCQASPPTIHSSPPIARSHRPRRATPRRDLDPVAVSNQRIYFTQELQAMDATRRPRTRRTVLDRAVTERAPRRGRLYFVCRK